MNRTHHARPAMRRGVVTLLSTALFASLLALSFAPAVAAQGAGMAINELSPRNDSSQDEDGDTSDWIELRNTSGSVINLDGWAIGDSSGIWTIPETYVQAGDTVVFWASDKDRVSPQQHTNFKLSGSGETVDLFDGGGQLVDSMTYPAVNQNATWGRGSAGGIGLLQSATYDGPNTRVTAEAVAFAPASGTAFDDQLTVTMTAGAGSQIRYTTNGSRPTSSSTLYSGPITVTGNERIRAIAIENNLTSVESFAVYNEIASADFGFTSDLPIVTLSTHGNAMSTNNVDVSLSIYDTADNGRAAFDTAEHTSAATARIRGFSSVNNPKKQYKIDLVDNWSDDGARDDDLLGLGAESDWILWAPGRYDRNRVEVPLTHDLYADMGLFASDWHYVELYIDDDGNGQYDADEYDGLYVLLESIKISEERVDITKMDANDNAGEDVTGGYIFSIDFVQNDSCCTDIEFIPTRSYLKVDTPSQSKLTPQQEAYANNFMADFNASLTRSFTAPNGPQAYLDVDSFIGDHLLQTLTKDGDGFIGSNYFYKDRGGLLHGGPGWDFDRGFGSSCSTFTGTHVTPFEFYWYEDLWNMPEYRALFYMRWQQERQDVLSDASLIQRVDDGGAIIAEAWPREQARWGSNSAYTPRFDGTLNAELDSLKNWLTCRTAYLDGQFSSSSGAPSISNTGALTLTEQRPTGRSINASDPQPVVFRAEGLPLGMTIDSLTGDLEGAPLLGTAGVYSVKIVAVDSSGASSSKTMTMTVNAAGPANAKMVLNEYNAVKSDLRLGNNGIDVVLGDVEGNGGDWLEFVVIEDELDIRGWTFDLMEFDDVNATVTVKDSLKLTNSTLFESVRAGTIITIAESIPEDASYDPGNGDWTINLRSDNFQNGSYIVGTTQENFNTDENGFMVAIRDSNGALVSQVAGETETWDNANGGVSDNEVLSLCADPTGTVDRAADYVDHTTSSFGAPNVCPGGFAQPMALRPVINQPPTITNPGSYSGPIEDAVSIPLTASDPDGDALTVSVSGLPQSLSFNPATNTITGTFLTPGSTTVTATVSDPFDETDTVSFTMTATNTAPVITPVGNQVSGTLAGVSVPITVADANGHNVALSATGLPPGIALLGNSQSLAGIIQTSGTWTVTVTATDPFGLTDTETFVWSANTGPSVSSPGNQTGERTNSVNLVVSASDPDGGTLTYSATGLPGGLNINPTTGVISGTPTSSGQFNVTVTVTDGMANAATTFTWLINSAPTLATPPAQASAVNQSVSLQPTATDPDANNLTWTATGLPAGLSINANTGLITGSTTASGGYNVTIEVEDSFGETDTASFNWTVNSAPVFNAIPDQALIVNQTVSISIGATDADGDDLSWTATGLPVGLTINAATGTVSGTPTTPGIYSAVVEVADPSNATDQVIVTFTVSANNAAVAISTGCIGTNGRVDFALVNPNALAATFEISFPNLAPRTVILAPGQSDTETITGRADGNYTVTVDSNGTSIANETVAVTCDTPVTYTFDCVATNGLVRAFLNNSATTTGNYSVTIDGITKTLDLAAFESGHVGVSGRNDGHLTVQVTRNGVVVDTRTEVIDCDPDVEVVFTQSCLAGNGRLDFILTNVTGAPATYTVEVDGLAPRDIAMVAGQIKKTSITGRPDRDYPVAVRANGSTVWSDTITVNCDPDVEVTITARCLGSNGRIDVDITNTTASNATYTVTFDTFSPRATPTLTPGASNRQTITGRPDGPFPVTVSRNGTTIATSTETITCD